MPPTADIGVSRAWRRTLSRRRSARWPPTRPIWPGCSRARSTRRWTR